MLSGSSAKDNCLRLPKAEEQHHLWIYSNSDRQSKLKPRKMCHSSGLRIFTGPDPKLLLSMNHFYIQNVKT